MNIYRTHTCNDIRLENVGEEIKLSGFVKTIRDLGGCVFIDLRDHYGVTQLTTENPEILEKIKSINIESTITVTGKVLKRPIENVNPKIETGDVEHATKKCFRNVKKYHGADESRHNVDIDSLRTQLTMLFEALKESPVGDNTEIMVCLDEAIDMIDGD